MRSAKLIRIDSMEEAYVPQNLEIPLHANRETVVGRSTSSGFQIRASCISRQHVRFFVDNEKWNIEDLGSKNGTSVNDDKISVSVLDHGDTVTIGDLKFRYEIDQRDEQPVQPPPVAMVSDTGTAGTNLHKWVPIGLGSAFIIAAAIVGGIYYLGDEQEPKPALVTVESSSTSEVVVIVDDGEKQAAAAEAQQAAAAKSKRRAKLVAKQAAAAKSKRQAELATKQVAAAESKRQAELAAKQAAAAESKRQAELAAKQAAAAESKRQAELAAKQAAAAEAKRQAELAAKQAAAAESKRQAELAAKQAAAAESKRQAELAAKQAAAAESKRQAAAAESKRQAELAAKQAAAAEAKRQAELAAKQAAAAESKRQAELAAKQAAAAESKRQAELAAKQAAAAESKRQAELAAKQAAAAESKRRAELAAKQAKATQPTASPAPVVSGVSASSMTGRQILDEVADRHDKPYEFEIQQMTLVDRSGNEEKRELRKYFREVSDAETRAVSVFHAPSGVKGVAILTWQHDDKPDDQWLFLPAQGKKMKRIAKGGKKNYFMGTDYTYEDLVTESRDKFSYERLTDEALDGRSHFVVKAVATDSKLATETGYSQRVLWITQDTFVTMKVEFYDRRERLIKRQVGSDFKNVEGRTWRANKSVMEHLKKKHKTIVEVVERSFDESASPEKNFRQRTITSGKILR